MKSEKIRSVGKSFLGAGLIGLLVIGLVAPTAFASQVTLNFHGLGNEESVLNYFNGGLGGNGSGPGPSYGITFGSDSLALVNQVSGGSGNTLNEPISKDTCLFFLSGTGDVMNVAAGFNTGFSFYYSAPFYAGTVDVYSGLDGTGTLLASLALPTTPDGKSQYGYNYSIWEPIGVSFVGSAESVIFSGTANYIVFDGITLGASAPPSVPEPSCLLLVGLGLVGLAALKMKFGTI